MTPDVANRAAAKLIEFLEINKAPPDLFADDVFCDFSMPHWRQQSQGVTEVTRLRRQGHRGPGRVTRSRVDPTPTGFVLEVEERWEHLGEEWYARELFRADLDGDRIAALSVYCTGDWDRDLQRRHQDAVRLLRP
jgi:hypothetical protein